MRSIVSSKLAFHPKWRRSVLEEYEIRNTHEVIHTLNKDLTNYKPKSKLSLESRLNKVPIWDGREKREKREGREKREKREARQKSDL